MAQLHTGADAGGPVRLPDRRAALQIAERKVGVAYFVEEVTLARVFERLYAWAAPGSQLGSTTFVADHADPNCRRLPATYDQMGVAVYQRSPEQIMALVGGWRIGSEGMGRLEILAQRHLGTAVAFDRESGQLGYGGILYRD